MRSLPFAIAINVISATACSERTVIAPDEDALAIRFEVVSGNNQQAALGATLPAPLVVRVVNASGQPVAGQIVNFVVTGGGGSVFAGSNITNAQGIAQEWWTVGGAPGSNSLEVRAVDNVTSERLVYGRFTAQSIHPPPSDLTVATAPRNADTYFGTVSWHGDAFAVFYEWTLAPTGGSGGTAGFGSGNLHSVTMHLARSSPSYNFCVRSVASSGGQGFRSSYSCVTINTPPS